MYIQQDISEFDSTNKKINFEFLHRMYIKNYIYLHAKHPEASDLDCMAFASGVLAEEVLERYLKRAIDNSDFESIRRIHEEYMRVVDLYEETGEKIETLFATEPFVGKKLINVCLRYAEAFSKRTNYAIEYLVEYGNGEVIKLSQLLEKDEKLKNLYLLEKKLESEYEEVIDYMMKKTS